MDRVTIDEAEKWVRSRIDELPADETEMAGVETDDRNLSAEVGEHILQAIDDVLMSAPAPLLEADASVDSGAVVDDDGVIEISLPSDSGFLRLVSFRCGSSPVVTSPVFEDSPKGRMQLVKSVRGESDDPVLVLMADSESDAPHYKYYSAGSKDDGYELSYKKRTEKKTDDNGQTYCDVPAMLKHLAMDRLTGLILRAYEDNRCQSFLQQV